MRDESSESWIFLISNDFSLSVFESRFKDPNVPIFEDLERRISYLGLLNIHLIYVSNVD